MPKSFYNTIRLDGEDLKKANARAATQEQFVRALFLANPEKKFSPSEVMKIASGKYQKNCPITSWRRTLTNLTYEDFGKFLVKTEEQREGIYGKPESKWALNKVTSTDQELQEFLDKWLGGELDDQEPKSKYKQVELF